MPRKRLPDLLNEEAQKLTPPEGETTIDVNAETIVNTEAKTEETTSTVNTADLEATIQNLQAKLEQAQTQEANLQQQIKDLQTALSEQKVLTEKLTQELENTQKAASSEQKALTKKFNQELDEVKQNAANEQKSLTEKFAQELEVVKQNAANEQKSLTEKFIQELEEAKQTILQLAESNSQLIEAQKAKKQPQPSAESKISSTLTYRKSHLAPNLPVQRTETAADDFSNNTWLYD